MGEVSDRVGEATATLVCSTDTGGPISAVCNELQEASIAADRDLLWVSYTRSPAAYVEALPDGAGAGTAVILVGDAPTDEPADGSIDVETVSTPTDLIALGIKLNQYLAETDGDLMICFDSVTAMLEYVDVENAYRFLHIVVSHLADAGARAHFHLDPSDLEESTVDAVVSLCDAVVDLEEEPGVRRRSTSVD